LFFIGVFGIESKEKEIREIQNKVCKSCGKLTSYRLVKTYNYFHFFFIPTFRWSTRYYLIARCCRAVFEIPPELGRELEGGRDVPIRDEDLTRVGQSYGSTSCPSCGNPVEPGFAFCPHCGTKMH
jgi:RNA polymerase subunit RPABC4/transcription elongation factor Spt4